MRFAIVGCGFVADYYARTYEAHRELELIGVFDRRQERASKFASFYNVPAYRSLLELQEDPRVDIVVNLTNPGNHYEVSKTCLLAEKHVYSEKPLATEFTMARELVELAEEKRLQICSAPCSVLGETAQTLWKALREKQIGDVRVVYAEMDDGLIHRMPYRQWHSDSGTPWPYEDEFEVGCTLEHAGYYLTWLVAFFGRAESVTAFSSCLIPDKQADGALQRNGPDFSVACIKFACGIVARLTCSIIAPRNHGLRIVGDGGILRTADCWNYRSPVYIERVITIRRRTFVSPWRRKYPLVGGRLNASVKRWGDQRMDFARGVAEMADAIREKRVCRLSGRYSLHVNEIVLAIHNASENGSTYSMTSKFDPLEPMPWAQ